MRKTILLLSLLLTCSLTVFGQIRDYVFVVKPNYGSEMELLLENVHQELMEAGYSNIAEYYGKNGYRSFGSGFHYKTPDGEHFIITNYHVVTGAESTVLEWQDQNGRNQSVSATEIIAVDEGLDLAIIKVNEGFTFKPALNFALSLPDDGDEVWSAGYPGLGGNPSWQLGQGTVTNHRLWLDELIDSDRSFLIQHSAPVDPGNSGGPLLVKTPEASSGYEVIGINTWKVFSRQATNFAVPAPTIQEYLGSVLQKMNQDEDPNEIFDHLILISELYSPQKEDADIQRIWELSRFISNDMVAVYGKDALLNVLGSAPKSIREGVLGAMAGASPLEGLRVATAYQIDDQMRNLSRILDENGNIESIGEQRYRLTIPSEDGAGLEMEWVYEFQTWRIASLEGIEIVAERNRKSMNQETPQPPENRNNRSRSNTADFMNNINFDFSITAEMVSVIQLSYLYGINNYFQIGLGLGFGSVSMAYETYGDENSDSLDTEYSFVDFFQFSGIVRAQAVIGSSYFAMIPYAELQLGGQLDTSDTIGSAFLVSPGAGIDFASGSFLQFKYGAAYNYMMMINGETFSNNGTSLGAHCMTITFGLAF